MDRFEKRAQRRGRLNKLREKINFGGKLLEGLSPDFKEAATKMREVDDATREKLVGLKSVMKKIDSLVYLNDYLVAADQFMMFHDICKYVAYNLAEFVKDVNHNHFKMLLDTIDKDTKSRLFAYDPKKLPEKKAGVMDWARSVFTDRGRLTKNLSKRFSLKFFKELQGNTKDLQKKSQSFMDFLLKSFDKLNAARNRRKVSEYEEIAKNIVEQYAVYDKIFNKYHSQSIIPLKKAHEEMVAKEETEGNKDDSGPSSDPFSGYSGGKRPKMPSKDDNENEPGKQEFRASKELSGPGTKKPGTQERRVVPDISSQPIEESKEEVVPVSQPLPLANKKEDKSQGLQSSPTSSEAVKPPMTDSTVMRLMENRPGLENADVSGANTSPGGPDMLGAIQRTEKEHTGLGLGGTSPAIIPAEPLPLTNVKGKRPPSLTIKQLNERKKQKAKEKEMEEAKAQTMKVAPKAEGARDHSFFIHKISSIQNPSELVSSILDYSEEIDASDPVASSHLIQVAAGIWDDIKNKFQGDPGSPENDTKKDKLNKSEQIVPSNDNEEEPVSVQDDLPTRASNISKSFASFRILAGLKPTEPGKMICGPTSIDLIRRSLGISRKVADVFMAKLKECIYNGTVIASHKAELQGDTSNPNDKIISVRISLPMEGIDPLDYDKVVKATVQCRYSLKRKALIINRLTNIVNG